MRKLGMSTKPALKDNVAAVSCGIYHGEAVLDLDYAEDSVAQTDANFVLTGAGGLVEVPGTAEGAPFTDDQLMDLQRLARKGIRQLVQLQKEAVGWNWRRAAQSSLRVTIRGSSPKFAICDSTLGLRPNRHPSSASRD